MQRLLTWEWVPERTGLEWVAWARSLVRTATWKWELAVGAYLVDAAFVAEKW